MRIILLGLILALTTLSSGSAYGRDRGHGGRWMEKLNLTEEQKPKVKAIREESKAGKEALKEKAKAARQKLKEAIRADKSDASHDNTLRQLYGEVKKIQSQMHDARFEALLKIRKVLTPEQRQKMKVPGRHRMGKKGKKGRERRDRSED